MTNSEHSRIAHGLMGKHGASFAGDSAHKRPGCYALHVMAGVVIMDARHVITPGLFARLAGAPDSSKANTD